VVGENRFSSLFKVTTSGSFTNLSNFDYVNGGFPSGGLTQNRAGVPGPARERRQITSKNRQMK